MSYTSQVFNRNEFAKKAREESQTIRILRSTTVIPVVNGSAVVMQPALVLTYSFDFPDPSMGPCSWVYRETVPEDVRGNIDLTHSLWQTLEKERLPYRVVG